MSGAAWLLDQNLCPEKPGRGSALDYILWEFSSILRSEKQNELLERNFPNAESTSGLFFMWQGA